MEERYFLQFLNYEQEWRDVLPRYVKDKNGFESMDSLIHAIMGDNVMGTLMLNSSVIYRIVKKVTTITEHEVVIQ